MVAFENEPGKAILALIGRVFDFRPECLGVEITDLCVKRHTKFVANLSSDV